MKVAALLSLTLLGMVSAASEVLQLNSYKMTKLLSLFHHLPALLAIP